MRVAVVAAHECSGARAGIDGAGGLATYVRGLSLELAQRQIDVNLFTAEHGLCAVDDRSMHSFARVHHIALAGGRPSNRQIYERRHDFVEAISRSSRDAGRNFNLVYSHYWISGLIGSELSRRWRVPHATTFHTHSWLKPGPLDTPFERRRLQMEERLTQEVDGILTSSVDEAKLLASRGVASNRLYLTPPGVDTDHFRPRDRHWCRRQLGLPIAVPLLLWVGRLDPIKGLEDLMVAHSLNADTDALLIVLGGCGRDAYRRKLQGLARARGLEDKVLFVEATPHSKLSYYYAAADIFVFPSHYESFGLAALEASASGIPTVATHVGGLRHLVQDGQTGVLVRPRAPVELAAAMRVLLEDSALRRQLGVNARRMSLERQWSRAAALHVDAFAQLCGSRALPARVGMSAGELLEP